MVDVNDKGDVEEISLDTTLDDIEDLPGFNLPPTGAYNVTIDKVEWDKEINQKKAIEYTFKINEVIELTASSLEVGEDAPKQGDMFSAMWFKNNKFALDGLKKEVLKPISSRLGTKVIKEIVDQSAGLMVLMVVKRSPDKKKPEVNRLKIKKLAVI